MRKYNLILMGAHLVGATCSDSVCFPTEMSVTWKNSPLYFLICALVNSSLLHLVSFLFSEPFLLSFSGASHNLVLGDAMRETECKQNYKV